MKCVKCGHEISENTRFCPYCGEKVAEGNKEEEPIYLADVKSMLKSGRLVVYRDRVEFISSSVQKTVFNYSSLVSVKKGLDRINFITEDGLTESCIVNRKIIHEAFLYIEKASKPYIDERKKILLSQGIKYSLVSSMGIGMTGGILNISDDQAEFKGKTGQSEYVHFSDVKKVRISMGMLEFLMIDGTVKSFSIDKDIRDEVVVFVENAIKPYIAERKEALLSRGINYSFLSSQGSDSGTLDIMSDRVEYKNRLGQSEIIFFKDVRAVCLYMGVLELSLTNGASKTFTVDPDICNEVLSFVENAIRPYVVKRTVDFDMAFGIDEKVEVNEKRGVFHIIRQGGKEITDELPVRDVIKCERVECSAPGNVLNSVLSGGMAILNSAVRTVGTQGAPDAGEKITYAGIALTVRTERGERTESIRFGDFPLGMSQTNKKYEVYIAEIARFMNYLGNICPECEMVVPALLEAKSESVEIVMASSDEEGKASADAAAAAEEDQFGIIKYIQGVSGFIDKCATPMTIAIQGSWGNGKNSIMKMLSNNLEGRYKDNLLWFHTWQFAQSDLGEQSPLLVGNRLISLLGGANNAATKERAVKAAKGLINITSGFISQGSTDGQNLIGALFKDSATNPVEKVVRDFAELVRKRVDGKNNKVIIFVDDLDKLSPAKGVELLEAMRNFYDCEGCVFVMAVDYGSVIHGAEEKYGQSFDENKGKNFFDKMFQVSFRVPVFGYNIQNYVKDKLEHLEIHADDERELDFYVDLIRNSVGSEPKDMEHLFNSFQLLKMLADKELYRNRVRRLMLFALLCMQARFHDIYGAIVRVKDRVTPELLSDLCNEQPMVLKALPLNDDEKVNFRNFARIFYDIIDTNDENGISESECKVFTEVLEFSCITAK